MNRNTTHIIRAAGAPAYYLGRPAAFWQTALRRRARLRPGARPPVDRTTGEIAVAGPWGVR